MLKRSWGGDQHLAAQHAAQGFDLGRRPIGEVGQGALKGFFAFAPALAEEDGGPGVTVGDGFDVDGNILSHMDILNSPIVNGLMRNLRLFVRGTSA